MTIDSIPLIDLSPWTDTDTGKYSQEDRQKVVQQVEQACRDIGFFAVQHHAVDESVVDAAWTASTDFFDLPMDTKLESKTDDAKVYPFGYEQSERLTLGKELSNSNSGGEKGAVALSPADLKETFSLGPCNPDAGELPRRFPAQPATFQPALENYYAAMEDLAALLLRIFAMALKLPPDYFKEKMDHHGSALRVLNYFAIDSADDDDDDAANDRPLRVRAGAHTDYGALTILKSGGPGLQVQKDVGGGNNDDAWVDVPHLPAAYIINLGDLMQQWTNDKWVSTLHRVIVPNNSGPRTARRQSMAFFVNVNGDTLIEPLSTCVTAEQPAKSKYAPVTARQHIMAKYLATMGHKEEEKY